MEFVPTPNNENISNPAISAIQRHKVFTWCLNVFLRMTPVLVLLWMIVQASWHTIAWSVNEYGWVIRWILASFGICIDGLLMYYTLQDIDMGRNGCNIRRHIADNTAGEHRVIAGIAMIRLVGICIFYGCLYHEHQRHTLFDVLQRSILFGLVIIAWSRSNQIKLLVESEPCIERFDTSDWEVDHQLMCEDLRMMAITAIGRGILYGAYLWGNEWYIPLAIIVVHKVVLLSLCWIRFCELITTNQFAIGTITSPSSDDEDCCICAELMDSKHRKPIVLPCSHRFCSHCIRHLLHNARVNVFGTTNVSSLKCPYCMQIHTPRTPLRYLRIDNQVHAYYLLGL